MKENGVETKERHRLSVLGPEGHAEIVWDVHDFESIAAAKKMFDDLVSTRRGYQAFVVLRDGAKISKGSRVKKFDPSLEEIIMVPLVSGG